MSQSIEGRLGEVEKTSQTDDQTIDFSEGGEAEDFGCVVAVLFVSQKSLSMKELYLRDCGVVEWTVDDKEADVNV